MARRGFKVKNKLNAIRLWRRNKSLRETAKRVGIQRSTLRRWIKQEPELRRSSYHNFRQHVQRE